MKLQNLPFLKNPNTMLSKLLKNTYCPFLPNNLSQFFKAMIKGQYDQKIKRKRNLNPRLKVASVKIQIVLDCIAHVLRVWAIVARVVNVLTVSILRSMGKLGILLLTKPKTFTKKPLRINL